MKRISRKSVLVLVLIMISVSCLGLTTMPNAWAEDLNENFEDNSLLVVLTREATLLCKTYTPSDFYPYDVVRVDNMFMNDGTYEVSEDNRQILFVEFSVHSKENVLLMRETFSQRNDVEYASPNYIFEDTSSTIAIEPRSVDVSNNAMYESQISIVKAQEIASNNPITVGIIDTGLDFNHPAFSGRIDYSSSCYIDSAGNIQQCDANCTSTWLTDTDGHGTFVASVLGSNRTNNIGGLFPCVQLGIIKCYSSRTYAGLYRISKAFEYARNKEIPIVNWSCALPNTNYSNYDVLLQAIQNYPGLFVTIAYNNSSDIDMHPVYPACEDIDNMIVVGAVNKLGYIASISNYGAESVDLMAPGEQVVMAYPLNMCSDSCDPDDHVSYGYHKDSGTSFAAPHVAGVAAMILSKNPTLTPEYVKAAIMNSTEDLILIELDCCVTNGYLNAYKAMISNEANHQHTPSNFVINNSGHSIECIQCGYVISAEPHTYTYSNVTNTTHKQTCTECEYSIVTDHLWTVMSSTVEGHVQQCDCGEVVTQAHTYSYSDVTNTTHKQTCTVCEYNVVTDHLWIVTSGTVGGHVQECDCGEVVTQAHTYSYSNVTNTTHKQTCTECGYNTVVGHLWRITSRTVTGHVKQCDCGHTVDELHTWVQNALGGYMCSVCRQIGNFTPGVMPLLTPRGRIALQSANLQHGQVILIEGLQIIYFDGEYYLLTESAMDTPTPVPPNIETE